MASPGMATGTGRSAWGATRGSGVGAVVVALGVGSLLVLAVQPTLDLRAGVSESIYSWYHWSLAVVVAGTGLTLVLGRRRVRLQAAAVGAVAAAQLAGVGLVAHEKWLAYFGPIGGPVQNHRQLEQLALGMTACCALAAILCVAQLVSDRAFSLSATSIPLKAALAAAGVAVAVAVPVLLTRHDNGTEAKTLLALAAVYGVPWGLAIAASGWLQSPAAVAAGLTVAGSASAAAYCDARWTYDFEDLVIGSGLGPAFAVAAGVAAIALLARVGLERAGHGSGRGR
jgi:hypothetical protein